MQRTKTTTITLVLSELEVRTALAEFFKVTARAVTMQVDHEGRVTAEVRNATIEEGLGEISDGLG